MITLDRKKSTERNSEIAARLTEIRGNVRRLPWVQVALLLRFVQQNAVWPFEGAASYSEWLEQNAKNLGAGLTMLRMYGWMAQYYENDLRPKLLNWNHPAPPLSELPEYVGPELLSDLRKISRAGVPGIEEYHAGRVMQGIARRAELRECWVSCRKTIKSNPHTRGRIPAQNYKTTSRNEGELLEAQLLNALLMHQGIFSKSGELIAVKVIQGTEGLMPSHPFPDFVLACKDSRKGVSLQAVEAGVSLREHVQRYAESLTPFFDKVWVAVPRTALNGSLDVIKGLLKKPFGILVIADGKVSIWKDATPTKNNVSQVELVARLLLARELW